MEPFKSWYNCSKVGFLEMLAREAGWSPLRRFSGPGTNQEFSILTCALSDNLPIGQGRADSCVVLVVRIVQLLRHADIPETESADESDWLPK